MNEKQELTERFEELLREKSLSTELICLTNVIGRQDDVVNTFGAESVCTFVRKSFSAEMLTRFFSPAFLCAHGMYESRINEIKEALKYGWPIDSLMKDTVRYTDAFPLLLQINRIQIDRWLFENGYRNLFEPYYPERLALLGQLTFACWERCYKYDPQVALAVFKDPDCQIRLSHSSDYRRFRNWLLRNRHWRSALDLISRR